MEIPSVDSYPNLPLQLQSAPIQRAITEERSFRSVAEVKVEMILDEMEEERNNILLMEMSGKKCSKRQHRILREYDANRNESNWSGV